MKLNLDLNKQNILSMDETTEVLITAHGETHSYRPLKNPDGSWDLKMLDDKKIASYGLSCENINELKALLLADYATGIITNFAK